MVLTNNFLFYDILFLIFFTIWVVWFLYTRKHNLKREGIIYLYRTQLGVKFIDYIGKKYRKTIGVAQYFAITIGFILMGAMLYLLSFTIYTYIKFPQITQTIKAPPILPLIPYFPTLFGLESFFPPLYFTYWIIAILIVAVVHEFSHGIFAKFHGLRIKSTGFAFLGPILGAFVEPDEKEMQNKGNFAQMSILSAGVFANILTAIIFFAIMWITFSFAFAPAGVVIHSYPSGYIEISNIKTVNGLQFDGDFNNFLDKNITNLETDSGKYLIPTDTLKDQLEIVGEENSGGRLNVYLDAPAIRNNIFGAISKIDGEEIKTIEDLSRVLDKKSPGQIVEIEIINSDGKTINAITLDAHPITPEKAFLGINLNTNEAKGIRKFISNTLFFKNPGIYYQEKTAFPVFIYYLVWWIVLINFFVALFNMLPVGILDGGRFFYLTILSVTKSEKVTKIIYKMMSYFILLIFVGLILSWIIAL